AGEARLPPALPAEARRLVAHLFVVEGDAARQLTGGPAPAGLRPPVPPPARAPPPPPPSPLFRPPPPARAAPPPPRPPPRPPLPGRRPFLQRRADRGPRLPEVVGDGKPGNEVLSLSYRDHAGAERLRSGTGSWPDWEVDVRFNDFFRSVLEDSHVRVAIDPAV